MWKSIGILRLLRLLEHRSIAAVALVLHLVMINNNDKDDDDSGDMLQQANNSDERFEFEPISS